MSSREAAKVLEGNLWAFSQYVLPDYSFSDLHREVLEQMSEENRSEHSPNLLFLLPRDHLKSVMVALYTCWKVAKNAAYTILYITANEDLGRLQMSFIQNIFVSKRFKDLWPDHFTPESGRRDKWTTLAINCDHPLRKERNIRDETIAVKTIKSDKTGRHPDEIIYDDLVVPNNAYTEMGRSEVRAGASEAVSLAKNNALMTAVGTVYTPNDQYSVWKEAIYQDYTHEGEFLGEKPLWVVREEKVEDKGDGTGTYLWPRVWNVNLKQWFGWDIKALSKKKAEYVSNGESTQFYAQYYMQANDPSSFRISYDKFRYWNPAFLTASQGTWFYKDSPLSLGCYMDAAVTDASSKYARKADFTALCVIGMDTDGFYYVLDLKQFQTDKRQVYYEEVINLWKKWGFKKLIIEIENAGKIIASGMNDSVRKDGYSLIIDGHVAPRGISKHERHASITIPKYSQGSVLHEKGGWTNELEEQIVKLRPAHDDLLDVVTMGLQYLKPPASSHWLMGSNQMIGITSASERFGGRRL